MKVVRNLIAALALTLALPAAAQAAGPATITVSKATTPAGSTTPFTFHVTGPACNNQPTDLTFQLMDGQSKVLTLCDSPTDQAHRFKVTEEVLGGWTLSDIQCTQNDTDPADRFIIDMNSASAFVELSPGERKACKFINAAAPTPAPTPAPAPATPAPAPAGGTAPATQPGATGVLGEQVNSPARATANVRVQAACAERNARVTVSGRSMRQVRFSVRGRTVRTVNVRPGQRLVRALVPLRQTGPAAQTVKARVTFRNGARARVLSATARRCAQAGVAPQFTG